MFVYYVNLSQMKSLVFVKFNITKKPRFTMLSYNFNITIRKRPEMFKAQLRALYRASVYGNLGILLISVVMKFLE